MWETLLTRLTVAVLLSLFVCRKGEREDREERGKIERREGEGPKKKLY